MSLAGTVKQLKLLFNKRSLFDALINYFQKINVFLRSEVDIDSIEIVKSFSIVDNSIFISTTSRLHRSQHKICHISFKETL